MLKRQRVLFHRSFVAVDLVVVATASGIAASYPEAAITEWSGLAAAVTIVALAWASLAPRFDLYRSRRMDSPLGEVWAVAQAWTVSFALACLAMQVAGLPLLPLKTLIFTPVAVLTMRTTVRLMLRAIRVRGRNYRQSLIVGEGRAAQHVAAALTARPEFGVRVLGSIGFGTARSNEPPVEPWLGPLEQLAPVLAVNQVDYVVVCPPRAATGDEVEHVFRLCDEAGIPCHLVPAFLDLAHLRPTVTKLGDFPVLSFEGVRSALPGRAMKRVVDIVVAIVALVLLAPAMAVIAGMVRRQDGGPAFFVQTRVGRHGRQFPLYKFRTMTVDAETRRNELALKNEVDGPVFKIAADPRVTPLGRFLRKYSLDELPQLFNVLRGEMSIVGPRPPIPQEVAKYAWWQRRRLSVKPGLTCTWQVSGRNGVTFDRWMEMDLAYIDSWSLALDFKLMLKTLRAVFRGTGC